ncbi:transporter substrate-binding domain-containing protein [Vibrio sp. ABG19]|uniref:substrate-binding periplasmic protein n=1 Tax=Vibrio sp. ABG19 TaxID=2817385 RepID=UPI00249EB72F|nr:transporter substrate-binding domain-containing protein [Vibrio sp. ABG19]WGY47187.1 transporter substrate-binding domain-containing protein [Vibrio sp. ABG19]
MRHHYSFALLSLAAFCFAARGDNIIHAIQAEWPPYVIDNPQMPGLAVELVSRAFATQGYTLQLTIKPWNRALKEAQYGRDQIVLAAWYSEQRTQSLAFSKPYLFSDIHLFARRGYPAHYTSLNDFKGQRIGLVQNYAYDSSLMTHPELTLLPAETLLINLRKLQNGRIDLLAGERRVALWTMHANHIEPGSLIPLEPELSRTPVHIMVGKNNPKAGLYLDVFEKGMEAIRDNGEYAAIMTKYESYSTP